MAEALKDPEPLPKVEGPADMLPAETLLAFQAKSGRRVFEVLQRDPLKDAFPEEYDKLSREVLDELGVDLIDPAGWVSIGGDLEGPAGFALLDIEDEAFCFWVTASDTPKMRRFIVDSATRGGRAAEARVAGHGRDPAPRRRDVVYLPRPVRVPRARR